jgi:hypothetical protein
VTGWQRSSCCTGEAGCIEVSLTPRGEYVRVRNSETPDTDPVLFTPVQWKLFLDVVKGDGPRWSWFRDQDDIVYSADEASAFREGVLAGEFEYEELLRIDEG